MRAKLQCLVSEKRHERWMLNKFGALFLNQPAFVLYAVTLKFVALSLNQPVFFLYAVTLNHCLL